MHHHVCWILDHEPEIENGVQCESTSTPCSQHDVRVRSRRLECRNLQKKGKNVKKPFTSEGPLWVISLDGHDKLCGYQNSTFPLGVYGCIVTFSHKILFLFVCYSNSNPLTVGKKYMEYLYRTEVTEVSLVLWMTHCIL